jgi:mannose-1-phosphate guanylyltransferase
MEPGLMRGKEIHGIILAAGLGERMRPLTGSIPKPLLTITGVPLLEIIARKLIRSGAVRLNINTFHLGDMIGEFVRSMDWPAELYEEEQLLDTGGGIGNMAAGLSRADSILLHNGDILSSIDLEKALEHHDLSGAQITLISMPPEGGGTAPPPSLIVDREENLIEIRGNPQDADPDMNVLGYTGTAVLSPDSLEYFPRRDKTGLVEILRRMISVHPGSVKVYDASTGGAAPLWGEIGSPASYLAIHGRILLDKSFFDPAVPPPPLPIRVGPGARVDPDARWNGFLDVGRKAVIKKDTVMENCIIMDGATVPGGSSFKSAVIHPDVVLEVET